MLDPLAGAHLAGLADGEGCFYIGAASRRESIYWICEFTIAMRDDDAPMLREIARQTGLGRVRCYPSNGLAPHPLAWWKVSAKGECQDLVDIFTRHPLRSKKQRDFVAWAKAVDAWQHIERRAGRGATDAAKASNNQLYWRIMADARAQLQEARSYSIVRAAS